MFLETKELRWAKSGEGGTVPHNEQALQEVEVDPWERVKEQGMNMEDQFNIMPKGKRQLVDVEILNQKQFVYVAMLDIAYVAYSSDTTVLS